MHGNNTKLVYMYYFNGQLIKDTHFEYILELQLRLLRTDKNAY